MQTSQSTIHDVIIIGAGISGIGTAYWLQKKCPSKSFLILEARHTLGGTWSLFQYPGIRSDSDMFTFGYRFKPWKNPQPISAGSDILQYLQETVTENHIAQKIRFHHKMVEAHWSDVTNTWTLHIQTLQGIEIFVCRFLSICSGYYSYDEAHRPHFEGEENFQGAIAIPQFWDTNLDYTNKRVVIVGSGATAITLVPAMADKGAAHVTMLQRSPTYVMNLPNRNGLFAFLKAFLPLSWAFKIARRLNILMGILFFALAKRFPQAIKRMIMKEAAKQLPKGYPVEKHFNPTYNPWDQRLCVVPDGDLFKTISSGKASVVTDHIDRFTQQGILLKSGEELPADLIVLATGLNLNLLGNAKIVVNDKPIHINEVMIYKGMMVSDVPNLTYSFGYTNASWTLKVDLTANFTCKLLNYMDQNGYEVVIPAQQPMMTDEPFLNLNSNYIQRAANNLPKQGAKRPWRVYQNYLKDMLNLRFGKLNDGVLKFEKG